MEQNFKHRALSSCYQRSSCFTEGMYKIVSYTFCIETSFVQTLGYGTREHSSDCPQTALKQHFPQTLQLSATTRKKKNCQKLLQIALFLKTFLSCPRISANLCLFLCFQC